MTQQNEQAQPQLDEVVMPIVLVMNDPNLSWQQRKTCAAAIQESLKQYRHMMEELKPFPDNDDEDEDLPVASRRGKK